jgi:hypothetical protein
MFVLVLRFVGLQLERDIQSLRERNTEVCRIFLFSVDFGFMIMWTQL